MFHNQILLINVDLHIFYLLHTPSVNTIGRCTLHRNKHNVLVCFVSLCKVLFVINYTMTLSIVFVLSTTFVRPPSDSTSYIYLQTICLDIYLYMYIQWTLSIWYDSIQDYNNVSTYTYMSPNKYFLR